MKRFAKYNFKKYYYPKKYYLKLILILIQLVLNKYYKKDKIRLPSLWQTILFLEHKN